MKPRGMRKVPDLRAYFIDVCATNGPLIWLLLAKFGLPLVALGSLVAQR